MMMLLWVIFQFIAFSEAYLPPSHFILKTWLNRGIESKTVEIHSLVTRPDQAESLCFFEDITWLNLETGLLESWALKEGNVLFYQKRLLQQSSVGALLLLGNQSHSAILQLKHLGVPILVEEDLASLRTQTQRRQAEKETLQRWKTTFAWVIGDQLWMEKDTFYPLRLLFSKEGSLSYDVKFENPELTTGWRYPQDIVLEIQQERVLTSHLKSIRSHASFHLNRKVQDQNGVPVELKELMQHFYAIFR